jgi:predicted alpha/beta-fold hydrolase
VSALLGHLWTVGPFVRHGVVPPRPPPSVPFEVDVPDASHGSVPLRGQLSSAGRRACVVAVHGLGGDVHSTYLVAFARAAWERGHDVLRMGMRGSDGKGDDVYHAGLHGDVAAVLASPALARYDELRLVGFSLGGHLALRAATSSPDRRLRAVAAIGSPLDLGLGQVAIDSASRWPYRHHVLRSLCALAGPLHARERLPSPLADVMRVRTLRDWDRLVVARRFGFEGPDAYYASESAAPHLARLALPGLYVGATHDPMVPADTVRPALARASTSLDVRWIDRAGHIGFPTSLDLGERGRRGLEPQLLSWLERAG